ncbi:hypothetical protein ACPW7J_02725 [Ihubacter sp. rT4E-8]|uniref:hypothetical protein n=1 Tax=unclassified Ihubacter TaxID=2633299 RepID=UPI003C7BA121
MKEKRVLAALLMVMICILLFSCKSGETFNSGKQPAPEGEAVYERLEINDLEHDEDRVTHLCYANRNTLIFTSGVRTDAAVGPYVDTEYIAVYDLKAQKVKDRMQIKNEEYVYHVIPYRDGIIYSSYEQIPEHDAYEWFVTYISDSERKVLDSGKCTNYDRIPQIAFIDETPVYLFENTTDTDESAISCVCGIKRVRGLEAKTIFTTGEVRLLETTLDSNGKAYCFLAVKKQELLCFVGDMEGIKSKFTIEGRIGSFDMNSNYVAVSLEKSGSTEESGNYRLLTLDLESGQLKEHDTKEILYRLKGGSGKTCVCVDWDFIPYAVNLENGELKELGFPTDSRADPAIRFFPLDENTYVAEFLYEGENVSYYKIKMNKLI